MPEPTPSHGEPPLGAGPDRLLFLDGWRGMAILLVILGHFFWFLPRTIGSAGVECFFVLSGRLMAEILIVRRHPLPSFVARRAARVLPALACYVLSIAAIIVATLGIGEGPRLLVEIGAAFGFFQNYLPEESVITAFQHLWSLAVEEHSYLLLALIAGLFVRDRKAAMIAAFALAFLAFLNGIRLGGAPVEQHAYWRSDVRAGSVLLSFGTFLWARNHFSRGRGALWGWASPLCLAAGMTLLVAPGLAEPVRYGAGTLLVALSVATLDVADARFRALFEAPVLVWFGLISFSLYLWQQPLFLVAMSGGPVLPCIAVAVAVAVASYHLVERPGRAWLNARWDERAERRALAAA
jgi:peptidoglycan/LPS O-acetylase OafA/YrhL